RCRGGIIYLPGAAGTVQEVFQAVTENYYAADAGRIAPLVLVGRQHWTESLPVWPLLQALGRRRAMGAHIHCVDTVAEAVTTLVGDGAEVPAAAGPAPAAPEQACSPSNPAHAHRPRLRLHRSTAGRLTAPAGPARHPPPRADRRHRRSPDHGCHARSPAPHEPPASGR